MERLFVISFRDLSGKDTVSLNTKKYIEEWMEKNPAQSARCKIFEIFPATVTEEVVSVTKKVIV